MTLSKFLQNKEHLTRMNAPAPPPWRGPPGTRGPMYLHRLRWLKASPVPLALMATPLVWPSKYGFCWLFGSPFPMCFSLSQQFSTIRQFLMFKSCQKCCQPIFQNGNFVCNTKVSSHNLLSWYQTSSNLMSLINYFTSNSCCIY